MIYSFAGRLTSNLIRRGKLRLRLIFVFFEADVLERGYRIFLSCEFFFEGGKELS